METPQGHRSGSSVLELTYESQFTYEGTFQRTAGISRGQAVAIDLPGGPVFALLRMPGEADSSLLTAAIMDGLAPVPPSDDTSKGMKDQIEKISCHWLCNLKADLPPILPPFAGTREPRKNWPLMVRFRDIHDPKSVQAVDPDAVGVRRVWVENTSDPVSTGIEKRFPPWFMDLYKKGATLSGDTSQVVFTNKHSENQFADALWPGNFSTEIGK